MSITLGGAIIRGLACGMIAGASMCREHQPDKNAFYFSTLTITGLALGILGYCMGAPVVVGAILGVIALDRTGTPEGAFRSGIIGAICGYAISFL